jgi:hypothetical protein
MAAPDHDDWTITVLSALRAQFRQPAGPSRAGADWAVSLRHGADDEKRVMVRTYADDVGAVPREQEAELVVDYLKRLLASGWTPEQYRWRPGELVVPAPSENKRAWWRFW